MLCLPTYLYYIKTELIIHPSHLLHAHTVPLIKKPKKKKLEKADPTKLRVCSHTLVPNPEQ